MLTNYTTAICECFLGSVLPGYPVRMKDLYLSIKISRINTEEKIPVLQQVSVQPCKHIISDSSVKRPISQQPSQPLDSYPCTLTSTSCAAITLVGLNPCCLGFSAIISKALGIPPPTPQRPSWPDAATTFSLLTGTCFTFCSKEQLIPGFQGSGDHSTERECEHDHVFIQ